MTTDELLILTKLAAHPRATALVNGDLRAAGFSLTVADVMARADRPDTRDSALAAGWAMVSTREKAAIGRALRAEGKEWAADALLEREGLTFAAFRESGVDCDDIGAAIRDDAFNGYKGRLYCGVLYILDTPGSPHGRWSTIIERSEPSSDSLEEVERHLWRWAAVEGYSG